MPPRQLKNYQIWYLLWSRSVHVQWLQLKPQQCNLCSDKTQSYAPLPPHKLLAICIQRCVYDNMWLSKSERQDSLSGYILTTESLKVFVGKIPTTTCTWGYMQGHLESCLSVCLCVCDYWQGWMLSCLGYIGNYFTYSDCMPQLFCGEYAVIQTTSYRSVA